MKQTMIAPFGRSGSGRSLAWPRRAAGSRVSRLRQPELWERVGEPFPASTVLEDLETVDEVESTQRILARFAATRLVLLALHDEITVEELAEEREIARSYAEVLREGDAERRVLGRLLAATGPRLRRSVTVCANDAAELASAQSHGAGAFWLHHVAYVLAVAFGWRAEALRAARALEHAAAAAGAMRSVRLWRGRAVALEAKGE